MQTSTRRLSVGLLSALVSASASPPKVHAGTGEVVQVKDASGVTTAGINLSLNYRFPPTRAQIDALKREIQIASRVFCDATDGAMHFNQVTLSAGGPTEGQADGWIYFAAGDARSSAPFSKIGADNGDHVSFIQENIDGLGGGLIAHEYMHYILGVEDEYYEGRRWGGACGIGEGSETRSRFGTVGDTRTEGAHTLAQSNPAPVCQKLAGGVWSTAGAGGRCDEDSDCGVGANDRCHTVLASELAMPKDFEPKIGTGDTADCPAGSASDTLFLVPRSGAQVVLGDSTATNTDDFATKTYAEAQATAVFTQDVEVIDGVGVFSDTYNRSSHRLTMYWQKRSATDWRVWLGFDRNKRNVVAAGTDPTLEIVGQFDVKVVPATAGCGDGKVDAALDEECEPGVAPASVSCSSLDTSSTVLSGTATCSPATCTWNRSACAFADSPNPFLPFLLPALSCGDGSVQGLGRAEQCEGAATATCRSTGTQSCTNCLNDPRTCTHAVGKAALVVVNDTNNDGVSEPFTLTIGGLLAKDTNPSGSAVVAVTPQPLQLRVVFDRDGDGNPDIRSSAVGSFPGGSETSFQQNGFGSCGNMIGSASCGGFWLREDLTKASSFLNGDWATTQHGFDQSGTSDWSFIKTKFPWLSTVVTTTSISTTENPECFLPTNSVSFVENVTGVEQVYMVLDTSGSMDTKDDPNGKRRIDDAQAAAQVYLDRQAAVPATGPFLDVGIVQFNTTPSCAGPGADACGLTQLTAANKPSLRAKFDGLVPTGMTAIGDALELARVQFASKGTKARERVIYLLSDGHHNAGTLTPDAALAKLKADGIKVVPIAFGEADEELLRKLGSETGGYMVQAQNSDQLASVYHELAAKSRGDSMLVSRTSSSAEGPVLMASADSFGFDVPLGGTNLMVLLSAQRAATWDPYVSLVGPDGRAYRKQANVLDPGVSVRGNAFVMIQIAAPSAGHWQLQLSARSGASFNSYLTVSVNDPKSRCLAGVEPRIALDADTVEISASTSYAGELDGNAVRYTGTIEGPAGYTRTLTFDTKTLVQQFAGGRPVARIPTSQLNGRGSYRVAVTCDVPRGAARVHGESSTGRQDLKGPVEPSRYTATNTFFVDTTRMPACSVSDCDHDGIPNTQESVGDTDHDGFPDGFDRDSDNDDLVDGVDPAPTTPQQPSTPVLTGEPMRIVAGVGTSIAFLSTGLVEIVARVTTSKPLHLGTTKLSFAKLLESAGVEYVQGLPATFSPAFGSTDFAAYYLGLGGQATVTPLPGGYLVQATLALGVNKPPTCAAVSARLAATTAVVLDDGTSPKITAVANETWRCLTDRLVLNQ